MSHNHYWKKGSFPKSPATWLTITKLCMQKLASFKCDDPAWITLLKNKSQKHSFSEWDDKCLLLVFQPHNKSSITWNKNWDISLSLTVVCSNSTDPTWSQLEDGCCQASTIYVNPAVWTKVWFITLLFLKCTDFAHYHV
jgi:hypothetical protein